MTHITPSISILLLAMFNYYNGFYLSYFEENSNVFVIDYDMKINVR